MSAGHFIDDSVLDELPDWFVDIYDLLEQEIRQKELCKNIGKNLRIAENDYGNCVFYQGHGCETLRNEWNRLKSDYVWNCEW